MRDRSIQFHFPDADIKIQPPPTWLTRLLEFIVHNARGIGWMGWTALALLAGVALFVLGRWLAGRNWSRSALQKTEMAPWQPSARQARLLLQDADALAAQGRFGDAVHLLLLVSIQEIAERRHGAVTPSLTSREIATLPFLSALAQKIFSSLARVVELSRFGNRPIGEAEYKTCRAAFEQFTQFDTWRMAA